MGSELLGGLCSMSSHWVIVRLLLAVAKIHKLSSEGINCVLAFPQTNLEVPVYMEPPMGFLPKGGLKRGRLLLCLNKFL